MLLRRWLYYLRSIPRLLTGIRAWPRTVALFLGLPVPRPLVIALRKDGLRFKVRSAMDVWVIKETCLDADYERYGAEIRPGWTVVDIGAGLGDFTLYASRKVGPAGQVRAFEPFPESYALLLENIKLNGALNIIALPYAVARQRCRLDLVQGGEAVRNGTVHNGGPGQVRAWGLAEALDGLADCDLLKVDCEGGEYDIFLHAPAEALRKLRLVCLEYHDGVASHSHGDLAAFFAGQGFEVSLHPNPAHSDIGYLTARRSVPERLPDGHGAASGRSIAREGPSRAEDCRVEAPGERARGDTSATV